MDARVVSEGAAAYGEGVQGAEAVRRRQRELRQRQGREHALKAAARQRRGRRGGDSDATSSLEDSSVSRATSSSWPTNGAAYTHVPKPPDWFEI